MSSASNRTRSNRYYTKHKVIGIYKIINKINGKYYIGSSKNIIGCNGRWKNHKQYLNKCCHRNIHLQSAWNKYGPSNFEFVIVERNVSEKDLLITEQKYLDIAKTEQDKCYNMYFTAGGGDVGKEIYRMRSEKFCGKTHHMYGKHHSEKTKEKMRLVKLGTGGPTHPLYGKKRNKETTEKISNSLKGRFIGNLNPKYDHTIYKFRNKFTSEIVECTRNEFCKKVNTSNIYNLLCGKRKSCKGWEVIRK